MEDTNQIKKNECPEFPFFGARYPDATCIDGYLWDLDSYEVGFFTHGGEEPCPFCNSEAYIQLAIDDEEIKREDVEAYIKGLREKYGNPTEVKPAGKIIPSV